MRWLEAAERLTAGESRRVDLREINVGENRADDLRGKSCCLGRCWATVGDLGDPVPEVFIRAGNDVGGKLSRLKQGDTWLRQPDAAGMLTDYENLRVHVAGNNCCIK